MLDWSNRGQGSCPQCRSPYSSRWKPANCSTCGYELGGSTNAKVPKLSCPLAVRVHGDLLLETIVVSCLKKEISGFVYIQSVKIFAPCMYQATGLRTLKAH